MNELVFLYIETTRGVETTLLLLLLLLRPCAT